MRGTNNLKRMADSMNIGSCMHLLTKGHVKIPLAAISKPQMAMMLER